MNVHGPKPLPDAATPYDLAVPRPQEAEEPDWQASALAGIKASDRMAAEAGMDPAALAETERQERSEHRWRLEINPFMPCNSLEARFFVTDLNEQKQQLLESDQSNERH